jgi:hypothetical protein
MVFCDVCYYSLVRRPVSEKSVTSIFRAEEALKPENGVSRVLQSGDTSQPNYKVPHPRRP